MLFNIIALTVASLLDAMLFDKQYGGFYALSSLLLFFPGLSVYIRRLHDTDHSGWWYWIILTVIGIIPLVIWIFSKGTVGSNKFGPDPLGGGNPQNALLTSSHIVDSSDYDRLEKLASLRDRGVVSEEEFIAQKAGY